MPKDPALIALETINKQLARSMKEEFPPGSRIGWLLMTFDFGPKGFMTYASNAERTDMVQLLRELASKIENEGR